MKNVEKQFGKEKAEEFKTAWARMKKSKAEGEQLLKDKGVEKHVEKIKVSEE